MSDGAGDAAHEIQAALTARDYPTLVDTIPYARFLGLRIANDEIGKRCYVMPHHDAHIGNPSKPALHGGTVAALLEIAMQLETLISQTQPRLPDPVDFTIDYWRSAAPVDCHAGVRLLRSGRQMARVQAECWQADRARPIAFARAAFLLRAPVPGASAT